MGKTLIILVLVFALFASILLGASCDGKNQVTTTAVKTTEIPDGQTLDIHIGMYLGTTLDKGLFFQGIHVYASTLQYSGDIRMEGAIVHVYNKGDRCLNVTGEIHNNTDQDLYINIKAVGYNLDMIPVSMPLSKAKITDHPDCYLPQKTVSRFDLILTWEEEVKLIEMYALTDNTTDYIFH